MEYKKTVKLSKDKIDEIQAFLDGEGGGSMRTEYLLSASFGDNGEGKIEIDIKVCDGDNPFVDAVLFQDGNDVGVLDCADKLLGEYSFKTFLENSYTVIVEQE